MDTNLPDVSEREGRLGEVLAALLEAQERGETSDPAEWLARYPEFTAELSEFFESEDRFRSVAAPLRQAVGLDTPPGLVRRWLSEGIPSTAGQRFGDYELLEEIGRGGMGVVYKARQKRPDRLVALKVVGTGRGATAEELQRFRNEADMAGQLDHPNIVPVYEVGERGGLLFFSMKLIEGGTLADRLRAFADDPRAAARLLAQVARAVHHAHQRGVLHRDLKPSNILLDADGRPHITDFGLAKRVEADGSLTQTGALLGTPTYMAPEQTTGRKGAVTVATDVHGLGAILYALLTSRPPFEGETVLDTLEQVKQREPQPPSQSNWRVDRDLATICLKCLEKEPGRRYASAAALVEDLERWLTGVPIQARLTARTERAWRWCRRNPFVTSLLAMTMGLLAAVLVVGLLGYVQTRAALKQVTEEKRQADANAAEATRQRDHAEANFGKALDALTDFMEKLDSKDGFQPAEREAIQQAFCEHMEGFFQRFLKENSEDPVVRLETAWAYSHLAKYHHLSRGDTARAEEHFRKALAILQERAEQFRTHPRYVDMVGHCYSCLASLLAAMGRTREAVEAFRLTEENFRLALRLNRDAKALGDLAWVLLSCPYPELRDPPLALKLAQEAVKLESENAALWHTLGGAYYRGGDWDAAVAALEKSVKLKRNGGTATDHFFLAMSHQRRGEEREARSWYEQGVRQMSRAPTNRFLQNEAAALLGIKHPSLSKEKEESPRKK